MATVDYPAIKKALWEAWRVFVPAFLGVLTVQLSVGAGSTNVWVWLRAILFAAILAGIKAVFKWARETYGQGDYSMWLYKLPL